MSDRTHPRRRRRLSAGDVRELARIEMARIGEESHWSFSPDGGTPPARQCSPSAQVEPILPLGSA